MCVTGSEGCCCPARWYAGGEGSVHSSPVCLPAGMFDFFFPFFFFSNVAVFFVGFLKPH